MNDDAKAPETVSNHIDPTGYLNWIFVERSEDTLMLRGPDGYIRLRKTPYRSNDRNRWAISIRVNEELVKDRSLMLGTDEQIWTVIKDEIDRIEAGEYD